MNNENSKKYSKIAKLIGILSGFILVLGTSYAVFRVTITGEKENVVSAGKLDVRIENEQNEIAINNALPQTEEEGKQNTPYTFDIVNRGNINAMYDMYIELSEDTTLPDNTVRYYLTKVVDNEEVALDEKSSHYLSDGIDSVDKNKKIYKVDTNDLIKPNETVSYKLYLWIDYDTTTEEAINKVFKGNIRVDASQVVEQEKTLLRKVDVSEGENGEAYAYVYADGTLEIKGNGKIKSGISDMNIYNADEKNLIENYKLVLTEMGYDVSSIKTSEDFANFIDQESAKDSNFLERLDLLSYILSFREVLKKHGYENTETIVDENSVMEYLEANGLADADGNLTEKGNAISSEVDTLYNDKYSGRVSIRNIKLEGDITNIPRGLYTGNENITEITIPSTVTSIDNQAFSNCSNLQNVTIPEGVITIGESAFHRCAVQSITIPGSVKTIGNNAFYSCVELLSIVIPNSVTTIENAAFSSCSKLESVQLSDNITTIPSNLFSGCASLKTIILPNVKTIGIRAFSGCTSLSNITLPKTLESIGLYAFNCCTSLENIVLPKLLTTIENYAFYKCTSMKNINLEDTGLTTLSGSIFQYCSSLESLSIPETVTEINDPFISYDSLKKLTILGNLSTVDTNSFSDSMIETLSFSKKVNDFTSWTTRLEYQFPNLKSINFDAENPNYTSVDGVVFSKDKTELICYPKAKEDLKYSIPTTTTTISMYAFYQVQNLLEIDLPSSLAKIKSNAIYNCTNLTILNIDKVDFSGGVSAVSLNKNLKKIVFSQNVKSIDLFEVFFGFDISRIQTIEVNETNSVFSSEDGVLFNKDKTKLLYYPEGKETEEYTIPSTVLYVGDRALEIDGINKAKFTKLNIPASLRDFCNEEYLSNCSNLKEIVVDSSNTHLLSKDGVLFSKSKSRLLSYPRNKADTSYVIPFNVATITGYAFAYNTNLTSVTIPSSVSTICTYAFYKTTNVSSITIPNGVNLVEPWAFGAWTASQTINIDNTSAYVTANWYSNWKSSNVKVNYLKS